MMFFKSKRLKKVLYLLMLVSLFLLSSCQDSHPNAPHHFTFEPPEDDIEMPSTFTLAQEVISNRCINCHSGYHDFWKNYKTEDDWVNEPAPRFGSVIPGDPDGSAIIYRLSVWGNGSEMNMPEDQPALSEEEYFKLLDWINSIQVN